MPRKRLDVLLTELGLADSRQKAQARILAGDVLVNNIPITKAGYSVGESDEIRLRGDASPFVGRGGEKLLGAISDFDISLKNLVCLDVGSSTGGFTDCMLQHGASLVYALDVGTNQLDYKLRSDPRVKVHEQTHVNKLSSVHMDPSPSFVTVDVSFISVKKIIPYLEESLSGGFKAMILVKPQFELEPEKIAKGGIPKSQEVVMEMLEDIENHFSERGYEIFGIKPCQLKGKKSENQEFFMYVSFRRFP